MRIKLFENFSKDESLKQNINDMLVELGDDHKFKWEIDLFDDSLKVGFTRHWDEGDNEHDYEPEDFFKLIDINEYVHMVVDFMKEKFPNVDVNYIATDPVGDVVEVENLDKATIEEIDNRYVNIGNSLNDTCSGLVYFGINFTLDNMIKKFESFFYDGIDTDKIKSDIKDILVELVDIGYQVRVIPSSYSYYVNITITKEFEGKYLNFNIIDLKDYLDMVCDYIEEEYKYDMQVTYVQAFSSKAEEYDNYELHLDKRVCSFKMLFGDFEFK